MLEPGRSDHASPIAKRSASYLADIVRGAGAAVGPYLAAIEEINDAFGTRNGGASVVVPTTTEGILAEWPLLEAGASVAGWCDGIARYDAAPLEDRQEMRAAAELMATGLAFAMRSTESSEVSVPQTAWNILVACALGNDESTRDADAERQMRLALVAVRRLGAQSPQLGGSGKMPVDFFDDTGNRMLMASSLSSSPWSFDVESWFTSAD